MSDRKKDHLDLTEQSQYEHSKGDSRFYYEPLLGSLPSSSEIYQKEQSFLGKKLMAPIWIGSMTGGTKEARQINHNLARLAGEFGLGMGLGSCRPLLGKDDYFEDFDIRHLLGDDVPFFANLGLAQVDQALQNGSVGNIKAMVEKLRADGLIIHINPSQEWFQPEGDSWKRSGLEIIGEFLEQFSLPVIVKEVGQGMGPASLEALVQLPLAAIEFGAFGGTNFSHLEMLRSENKYIDCHRQMTSVGHSSNEMLRYINSIWGKLAPEKRLCKQFIISGGIRSYLDGYYAMEMSKPTAIYGQANSFLRYARGDYQDLRSYAIEQLKGLLFSRQFLKVREV